jgi:hypothetical protein
MSRSTALQHAGHVALAVHPMTITMASLGQSGFMYLWARRPA